MLPQRRHLYMRISGSGPNLGMTRSITMRAAHFAQYLRVSPLP
jgi:hypothetical protein